MIQRYKISRIERQSRRSIRNKKRVKRQSRRSIKKEYQERVSGIKRRIQRLAGYKKGYRIKAS